jgi:hypothetical protein
MNPFRSLLLCCCPALLFAQPDIVIDGRFDDWSGVPVAAEDPKGELPPGATDLLALHLADDADYLYFSLYLEDEMLFQQNNHLTLYLDTDDDPATGAAVAGIGAEVAFTFGERQAGRWRGLIRRFN